MQSNEEMHEIMEMAFYLYVTSEDVPGCPLEQAMDTANEFAQRWKGAGLPKQRLLESFQNEYIRACILMDVQLHMKFTNKILDRLDYSWQKHRGLSPQRQILRCAEKKLPEQSQWGEQQ